MSRIAEQVRRWTDRRTSSRPIAAARIVFASAALLKVWDLQDKAFHLTGEAALLIPYVGFTPSPTRPLVLVLLGLWTVGAVGLLVGAWSRWSAVLLAVAIGSVFLLDQQLYSNHLYLLLVLAPLYAVAETGGRWSLDAHRHGPRRSVPAWPVDLLKVQLSIVYGFAAIAKVNAEYLRGDVLDVYVRSLGPWPLPAAWEIGAVVTGVAIVSVVAEAYLAVGFWLGRRARWVALALGVAFHAAIVATMSNRLGLTVFSLSMFSLYALFLRWSRDGRSGRDPGSAREDVD